MEDVRESIECDKIPNMQALYVDMAKTFAALYHQGVYIFDLETKKFVFSSDYPLLRCGLSEKEMLTRGFDIFDTLISNNERNTLKDLQARVMSYYKKIPILYRNKLLILLNFGVGGNIRG